MQTSTFSSTGSIAQDALRLGFQTTCSSGIETLLKVDDITIEACKDFKERHIERFDEFLPTFVSETTEKFEKKFFKQEVSGLSYRTYMSFVAWGIPMLSYLNFTFFIIAWFGYDKNNHMLCNI